ncbi:hypothetical protein [Streptomyces sp. NPDC049813]|uniref:hypothetical protein n=1 Tax=Streptomyces sp. NPDC049813 TaxID=3365597 RepID=UPI00378C3C6B
MSGGANGGGGPDDQGFFHRAAGIWTIVGAVCAVLSVVIALVAIKLGTAGPSDALGSGSGGIADPIGTSVPPTPTATPTTSGDPSADEPTPTPSPTDEPTDAPTTGEPTDEPVTDEPTPTSTYTPVYYWSSGTSFYSCDKEGQLASSAGMPITWRVENESSTDLTVYWLGPDGLRSEQRRLESGGSLAFDRVFTGSVFVFTESSSRCSKIVRVSPGAAQAVTTVVDKD